MLFQLSAHLFWGFQVEIPDLAYMNSEADIITLVKENLKEYLLKGNLQVLAEMVDTLPLHFHENVFTKKNQAEVVYICDHRHSL